jgi:hypothetical protein
VDSADAPYCSEVDRRLAKVFLTPERQRHLLVQTCLEVSVASSNEEGPPPQILTRKPLVTLLHATAYCEASAPLLECRCDGQETRLSSRLQKQ